MSIRVVAVHVGESALARGALSAAIALARRHAADLEGLHVVHLAELPTYALAELPRSVLDARRAYVEARAREAEAAFREATGEAGVRAQWTTAKQGPVADAIARHARCADLLVMAAEDRPLVEEVVLRAGGPVLVMPAGGDGREPGRRAMVAWSATRESARAVRDALPLLRAADDVLVVTVDSSAGGAGRESPTAGVCRHLERHGVRARGTVLQADAHAAGAALLAHAAEEGSDLLAMGAWGHSRLREMVLGGVTAHVLGHAALPAVLSH